MSEDDVKAEITFNEEIPSELEGKTLKEVFDIVKERNHEIIEKIKERTGDTIYTPEVEKLLTQDENMYLRLADTFKRMAG